MAPGAIVVLALLLGVLTGVLSSAVGVGGAVVSTPGIRALGATPLESVGSTLPSIFPSAVTGTLRYHREGLVSWPVVARVVPFGAAAAVAGTVASVRFPGKGHVQMILTALLVGFTAARTSRAPRAAASASSAAATSTSAATPASRWWRCAAIGVAAGALSGFLGIGGGTFMLPTFRSWLRLGLKETVATSLACVGLLAVPSTIAHAVAGTIDWTFAVPLSIGVIPGAHLGSRWAVAASDAHLRRAIGLGLGLLSAGYLAAEVIALAR